MRLNTGTSDVTERTANPQAELLIRIHWIELIRIRILSWARVLMTKKIKNKNTTENFFKSLIAKIEIISSLSLHKGRPSYRRSLQNSKEKIQHQKKKTNVFLCLGGNFCPPGSGSGSRIRIRIQRHHWIRIHNTAHRSLPLKETFCMLCPHCTVICECQCSRCTRRQSSNPQRSLPLNKTYRLFFLHDTAIPECQCSRCTRRQNSNPHRSLPLEN